MKHKFNHAAASFTEDLKTTGGRKLARAVYFTFMAAFLVGMLLHPPV